MSTPKSFAMVQWLRAFLNMSDDDKKSWGILQGYMPIDSSFDASGDSNFAHRKIFTSSDDGSGSAGYLGDQPFYLPLGQIPAFDTDEFFPPQVEINIRLYPFNSNWPLISDGADNYKVVVKATPKPYLVAYHPLINPKYAFPLERTLASASTPAATPYKTSRFETSTFPTDSACIASATWCPREPCPSESLWPCNPNNTLKNPTRPQDANSIPSRSHCATWPSWRPTAAVVLTKSISRKIPVNPTVDSSNNFNRQARTYGWQITFLWQPSYKPFYLTSWTGSSRHHEQRYGHVRRAIHFRIARVDQQNVSNPQPTSFQPHGHGSTIA